MTSFTCAASRHPIWSSAGKDGPDLNKQKLTNVKINGNINKSWAKNSEAISQVSRVATLSSATSVAQNGHIAEQQVRQNIPTKKQFVDYHRQGVIIEGGVRYRQTIVIRSYKVGPNKNATVESILNLFQETALNHVWMSGLLSNGFGATHGMKKNNLIWVVSRMHVKVDHYPIWGEVVEIDTWVGESGKNRMRRDWLIRGQASGVVFAKATSTWVMMNQQTRRLSKIPKEVHAELAPWFIEKQAIQEDNPDKIVKLDNKATYVNSDLKPKRGDLDMNHHVNNVKYVGWMLETIPDDFLETHQLSSIILEYRRECGSSDIVQSLCQTEDDGILNDGSRHDNQVNNLLSGFPLASEILQGNGHLGFFSLMSLRYTHLLQLNGKTEKEEFSEEERHGRKDPLPAIPNQLKNFETHAKRSSPKQPHIYDIIKARGLLVQRLIHSTGSDLFLL